MLPLLLALTTGAPPEAPVPPDLRSGTRVALQIPPPPVNPAPVMPPPAPPGAELRPPTRNRMFVPAELCAGPVVQPFFKHPRVCPVVVCDDCGEGGFGAAKGDRTWVKEFSSAAHVPIPRFDPDGQPVCGDGLVIYEGMRLTVDPDTGLYDLNFTATVPNTSVVLRMQLSFTHTSHTKHVDGIPTPVRYTLTLPPIRMSPPRDAKPGDPAATTFHIAQRGYSTLFLDRRDRAGAAPVATDAEGGTPPVVIGRAWEIKRDGTARFGTPVAIEDPNR